MAARSVSGVRQHRTVKRTLRGLARTPSLLVFDIIQDGESVRLESNLTYLFPKSDLRIVFHCVEKNF